MAFHDLNGIFFHSFKQIAADIKSGIKCFLNVFRTVSGFKQIKDNDVFSLPREEAINTLKNNAFNSIISEMKNSVEKDDSSIKEIAESELRKQIETLKIEVSASQKMLSNASRFIYDSLGDSPELKIFASDITRNDLSAQFLIGFGCDEFSEVTKTSKSDKELLSELDKLENL